MQPLEGFCSLYPAQLGNAYNRYPDIPPVEVSILITKQNFASLIISAAVSLKVDGFTILVATLILNPFGNNVEYYLVKVSTV